MNPGRNVANRYLPRTKSGSVPKTPTRDEWDEDEEEDDDGRTSE